MSTTEDAKDFEKGRIRALQEERLHIQKKTFTKWMNSFLQKAKMEVQDLFTDLADGRMLLKLLEIISGEKLGKPNSGKMRVHRIENVNKSLAFLHTKVRLENIGAEDIVDGNPRMILGLIWTIILRFQIQEIEIDVDSDNEATSVKKSAKDALLLWCQRKTNGYNFVDIRDFSSSWQSGLGFNALIHHHRPDLINFNSLRPDDHMANLRNAFDIAEKHLGIPRLLDPEDVDTPRPDEKSVITYVASYYHTFSKMKAGATGGKRIGNIVSKIRDIESQQISFETYSTELLKWIRATTVQMKKRDFPNSLEEIQIHFKKFKDYRMVEKPPKYQEKVEIEATYFDIQIKRQQLRQAPYQPPEGQRPHDIEQAWQVLEREEHLREVALKEELLRQEKLKQLALKFERKSVLREGYLNEMIQVLSDPRYGSNLNQVGASVKKHEAISADILAREERFMDLRNMSEQLQRENYHARAQVETREKQIMARWQELLNLLKLHKDKLERYCSLINLQREIETLAITIKHLQSEFSSSDSGSHLLDVQEKLQKFHLQESQVNAMAETIKKVQKQAKVLMAQQQQQQHQQQQLAAIREKLSELEAMFAALLDMCRRRQARLEDSHAFYQLVQDLEEEAQWLDEKTAICAAAIQAKDLRALTSLQQKHKAVEDEMMRRHARFQNGPLASAEELIAGRHPEAGQLRERCQALQTKWAALQAEAAKRRATLESSTEAYQFFSDCNETDSVIKECVTLARSKDFGQDKLTALSLLQRHRQLHDKIQAIAVDVARVEENGNKLKGSQISQEALYLTADPAKHEESEKLVAVEVWEDEPFERTEIQKVIENRKVPQVKALYPYSGHGLDVKKGEVMFLLEKTNADWWNVRRVNGSHGFIPANYVQEVEHKLVSVEVKKPVVIKDVKKVKRTQYVKQTTPATNQRSGKEIINERQKAITDSYALLQRLSKERQNVLQNSLKLFDFYSECEDFNKWLKEKTKAISTEEKDVAKATKAFEKFLTDFSANKPRLERIDAAVRELEPIFPELKKELAARQRETHRLYEALVRLQEQQEKNLEGSASVIFFQKSCEDVCDWITEKSEKLEMDDLAKDLTTVKALQRKHKGIERDLAPIKDKVGQVSQLGRDVIISFPNEKKNIEERIADVQAKWEMLEGRAAERSRRLEDAVGMQLFNNGVKSLLQWVEEVKAGLNTNEHVRDVQTAEELLNHHAEIGDDIRAKQDEFSQLIALGEKMYKRQPCQDVEDKVVLLGEERKAVLRGWQEKGDWLRQVRDLQLFNREADQIDASTSAQTKFLDTIDLGDSFEDVEACIKRHDDFSASLAAQEERANQLRETAGRLLQAGHADAGAIAEKRDRVLAARNKLKEEAAHKRETLEESKVFQEFRMQVQEMKDFIADKKRLVREDSFKDGIGNIKAKAKKHEVLDGEIKANAGQLKAINRTGHHMINRNHFQKAAIVADLGSMNSAWEDLVESVKEQGSRLSQAEAQKDYNRMTADLQTRLGDISKLIRNDNVGDDMRDCKKLLSQHAAAEQELDLVEQKVNGLGNVANDLAEGHFDGASIIRNCDELRHSVLALKSPAKARKEALSQSMKFHEFNFDLARELEWIAEKQTILSSTGDIQSLQQAQSAVKKHKKLEEEITNHGVVIDKVVRSGEVLLEGPSFAAAREVVAQTASLKAAWSDLLANVARKREALGLSLKAQQFYFEVAEIEAWIAEKTQTLKGSDYGKDEDSSVKLLTKHKGLELEVDTYSGIIQEMSNTAAQLIQAGHPDSKVIRQRDELLARELKALKKETKERRDRLVLAIQLHEYLRESSECAEWIRQQMSTARSQDLGQDYEHLELLLARFQEFKLLVQAGEEKYKACDGLAKRLENYDRSLHPDTDVKEIQAGLSERWYELIHAIQERDTKLESAGEIHRFNRDIGETLSRIQEKEAILQNRDVGRDTKSVQSLIRKHEAFENDLVALEAQLQVVIDDSAALQAKYPGDNANHIASQQRTVLTAWNGLQDRAAERKAALLSSNDYHTFMGIVRDLVAWSSSLRRSLITEEKVSDAASAQMLKAEHDDLKAEIETREKTFSTVVALGEAMVAENHSAAKEVKEKIDAVLAERQKLHTAWQHKKVYLDQLIDIHFYLRDAKQILSTSTSQEVALSNTDCGATIEEVEAHLKAHDAFQNLVAQQEEKVASLREHADKLVRQKHFDAATIAAKLAEIQEKRAAVAELCTHKSNLLNLNYLYAKFMQDAAEELSWIEEKKRKLQSNNKAVDDSNLTEKIKLLQKHQALQAEIDRHKPQITEVCTKGNRLIQKRHENTPVITENLNTLAKSWEELQHESNMISKGLEEARGILDFNNEVAKIESWIRDKELLVSQGDLGKDYEHCLELQKKLDDVDSDMRVDESRIGQIFQMADRLCSEAGPEAEHISGKKVEIQNKWRNLQGAIQTYRDRLNIAANIQAFQRDTDETMSRIREKLLLVDTEDRGRDLKDVQDLLKRLDTVKEYMAGLEKRLAEHKAISKELMSQYPDMTEPVREKTDQLTALWSAANSRLAARTAALSDSLKYHQFAHDCHDFQSWLLDMDKKIKAVATPPSSAAEADACLSLHNERRAELSARKDQFARLKQAGEHLVAEKHEESPRILAEIERTAEIQANVEASWERTRVLLLQGNELHALRQQHLRALAWLEEKEAFLNNDDLGDSLAAVEALVRKHQGFVTTLEKQAKVIDDLEARGQELQAEEHYEADRITEMIAAARARLESIKDKCDARMDKLKDSRQLYQFLRKVFDIKTWVKEKTQMALDESYYELSNLQNKIQKHSSFEAEIAANKPRLMSIQKEGGDLCQRSHFASQEIVAQLEDLQSEWSHLLDTSGLKRARLQEANSALSYLHSLEEVEIWLEEVEAVLESDDHGKDLGSVAKLLKKLQTTDEEVQQRRKTLHALEDQAEKFGAAKHFMTEELEQRFGAVQARYEALHEPLQIRRENLEDSLLLHQFNRDVADETFWLEEKLPLAASPHLGASLSEVQSLQQKHLLLETDIQSHEKIVNALVAKAEGMIRAQHFAAEDIQDTVRHLKEGYGQLRDLAALRKLRLSDAVESQQFFFKLNDALDWIKEKAPILKVKEVRNDEDSVQIYLKKINDILADIESSFDAKVAALTAHSRTMVERSHFDSANIEARTADLANRYADFRTALLEQRGLRVDQMALIEFVHEVEDTTEWINAQMVTAASEDYGKDVGHVEMLIKSFDSFLASVVGASSAGEARVNRVIALSDQLIASQNRHADVVAQKVGELTQLWEDLKELASARHEALNGAKQVHVFDKNADETISWIGEKEAEMSTDELGQDLETIQSLLERQQGLQRDLAAIQEQVAAVEKEAAVLSELFPDAAAHIGSKREETRSALTNLLEMSAERDERLRQNQLIQRYFDDYRELMAWSSEVMAKMTSPDLATDLTGAETLISRHKEILAEVDSRLDAFKRFEATGQELVAEGHFMAAEILEKIASLTGRREKLLESWQLRDELYKQHLDYLAWAKETDSVESWIASREPTIKDANLGGSIDEVEELLRRQQDFEGAILAQESKLSAVNRITLIEKNFAALRAREAAARAEEQKQKEQERLEAIKKKELARINNERRRENERRRTQEIKFNREDFEQMRAANSAQIVLNGKAEARETATSGSGGSGATTSPTVEESNNFFARPRGESMRLEPKKGGMRGRTPSFTTRRRTQSFRRHAATKNLNGMQNLPPVEVDGYLERKQELQSGGKRATVRSWKSFYTVLCGQLMCFFRDQEDFFESKAASPPVMIYQAGIETANDYTKKSFVFRLHVTDGSEFLFAAETQEQQEEWVKKLKFHASLPPAQQLTSYNSLGDILTRPIKEKENAEPVYANVPAPPLPVTNPPPQWDGDSGARGTRQLLSQRTSGSREPIIGDQRNSIPEIPGPVYANVDTVKVDRSATLPVHSSRSSVVTETDSLDAVSTHSREKKSSMLGRILGRKKV